VSPAWRRRLIVLTVAAAAVGVLLFALLPLTEGEGPARARRLLVFAAMFEALAAFLAPLFAAETMFRGCWKRALLGASAPLWVCVAAAPGELLLSLISDPGALGALLLAKLVALAAGLAMSGLVYALIKLTRRPLLATALAGALALAFALQPFYVRPAISALGSSGRTAARDRLIASSLRSPPMAAAYAMTRARPVGWEFVPHRTGWFYNHWLGTDFQISVPGPWRNAAEFLAAGVLLAALGVLRRKPPETDISER
jgi:hypothetical protein